MNKYSWIVVVCCFLTSCGFHLRGTVAIPQSLKILQISPNQPYEKFAKILIQSLELNGIEMATPTLAQEKKAATLILLTQEFFERTIAYESNGQPSRATLQFVLTYDLKDSQGNVVVDSGRVQVERELMLNPNAVLGTENERQRLQNELYLEAALQLIRQLSLVRLS